MTAIAASLPLPTPAQGAAGASDASGAGDVFGALLAAKGANEETQDQPAARPAGGNKASAKPAVDRKDGDRTGDERKSAADAAGQDAAAAQAGAAVVAAMSAQQQQQPAATGQTAVEAVEVAAAAEAQAAGSSDLLAKAADLVGDVADTVSDAAKLAGAAPLAAAAGAVEAAADLVADASAPKAEAEAVQTAAAEPPTVDLTKLAAQPQAAAPAETPAAPKAQPQAQAAADAAQPAAASLGDEIVSLKAVQVPADEALTATAAATPVDTAEVAAPVEAQAAAVETAKPAETQALAPKAGKVEVAAKGEAVVTAHAVAAEQAAHHAATNSDTGSQGGGADAFAQMATDAAPVDAAAPKAEATFAPTVQAQAAATAQAPAETIVRGSPETVAAMSAEIAKKLEAKSTRFDIVLTPEGLGKVDVQVRIGAEGKLTAVMAFENPQAAADLRHRAGELRQALSQAGFDVAENALKFDVSSQGGNGGQGQQQNAFFDFQGGDHGRRAFAGRAFAGAMADDIPTVSAASLIPGLRFAESDGVDVKI